MTMEERLERGMPVRQVRDFLVKEAREEQACKQLPWALFFFTTFLLVQILHLKQDVVHTLEQSIDFDLRENANFAFGGNVPFENGRMGHKSLFDVNSVADFWSWLTMGMVPLIWIEDYDVNEVRNNVISSCLFHAAVAA